jgi:hypothetical protein
MKGKTMNYCTVANNILDYFQQYRGKGHTRAVVESARNTRSIVVVGSVKNKPARVLRSVFRGHVLTLEEVEEGGLQKPGVAGYPLVLDNGAVVELLTGLMPKEEPEAKKAKPAKKLEPIETKDPE